MSALDIKLFRDVRRLWAQILAVALVVGAGVATLVLAVGSHRSLEETRIAYSGTSAPVLAVPESAVLDSGTRQAVLVDKGEGSFEPREVKLGRRGSGYVEVRQGVSEGEAVVTSANFLIDAESNLKAALKGFADPQGAQPGEGAGITGARP